MTTNNTFELDDALAKYVTKADPLDKPELVLMYSRAGSGKTHTAATASGIPGVKKVLYFDVEGSTVGVLNNFDEEKIDIVRLDKMDNGIQIFDAALKKLAKGDATGYDVIVVDPLDVLQDKKIKQLQGRGLEGWDVWREVAEWSTTVASTLKKIEPLGILVVHEREEKSESGAILSKLRISGSAKDTLPGIPDLIIYCERLLDNSDDGDGKEHTYGYVASSDKKVTKNRFGLPPVIKDVTLPGIWQFIDNKGKSKEKK